MGYSFYVCTYNRCCLSWRVSKTKKTTRRQFSFKSTKFNLWNLSAWQHKEYKVESALIYNGSTADDLCLSLFFSLCPEHVLSLWEDDFRPSVVEADKSTGDAKTTGDTAHQTATEFIAAADVPQEKTTELPESGDNSSCNSRTWNCSGGSPHPPRIEICRGGGGVDEGGGPNQLIPSIGTTSCTLRHNRDSGPYENVLQDEGEERDWRPSGMFSSGPETTICSPTGMLWNFEQIM